MSSPFQHVALIGLGLIAGSIALAQRRADPSVRVTGYARSAATRDTAREIGLCEVHDTVAETIRGADLVILCVPVGAMGAVMADIAPHLTPGRRRASPERRTAPSSVRISSTPRRMRARRIP